MSQHYRLPNFLIVGAPKSGTTTLWGWLKQHPEIFMTDKKETHYLIYNCKTPKAKDVGPDSVTTRAEYEQLFENVSNEIAVGEASPGYLCDPDVPNEIDKVLPGAKILAILRDPVERAWSSFTKAQVLEEERHDTDFIKALASETLNDIDPWNGSRRLIRMGLYGQQIERYFNAIGKDRMLIHLYEDLNNPGELLNKTYHFLGVSDQYIVDTTQSLNVTAIVRNKSLHNTLKHDSKLRSSLKPFVPAVLANLLRKPVDALFSLNHAPKPILSYEVRQEALKYFRTDIEKTSLLIGRDLSHWLA